VHASSDHAEIRFRFFELIRRLKGYTAHVVIAKKDIQVFNRKHNDNPTTFYFDVLHDLLKEIMKYEDHHYTLILSQHKTNTLQRFQTAVKEALTRNKDNKISYELEMIASEEMPELSIIDDLLWAVQRSLVTSEHGHFNAMKDKFKTILRLYEG
jgi:hypothetical protein